MTRDLHDAAVDATLQRLGDKGPTLRAEATAADPWDLVDQVLSDLAADRESAPVDDHLR